MKIKFLIVGVCSVFFSLPGFSANYAGIKISGHLDTRLQVDGVVANYSASPCLGKVKQIPTKGKVAKDGTINLSFKAKSYIEYPEYMGWLMWFKCEADLTDFELTLSEKKNSSAKYILNFSGHGSTQWDDIRVRCSKDDELSLCDTSAPRYRSIPVDLNHPDNVIRNVTIDLIQ